MLMGPVHDEEIEDLIEQEGNKLYCDVCGDNIICGNCEACSKCHQHGGWSAKRCQDCGAIAVCTNCGTCDHCGRDSHVSRSLRSSNDTRGYKEWAFQKRLAHSEILRGKLLHMRAVRSQALRRLILERRYDR